MSDDRWISDSLPTSWVRTRFQDFCDVVRGGSPRPMGDSRYFGGPIPFVKISDVTASDGRLLLETSASVTLEGSKRSRLLSKGTLILSNSGTICVPVFLGVDACIHDGFVTFDKLPKDILTNYLYHFFNYIRPFLRDKHKQGVTQVNLNTGIVGEIAFPLPPLNEQKRIVAKIEELFSELEAGEESFRKARRQLGVYRQSLLKQAFEGKLTAAWRQQNPHLLESPDQLLQRVQAEREVRFEEQLKEWKKTIKKSSATGDKKAPKPTMPGTVSGRIEIFESSFPREWHSMNLSQIALELGQGWSPKCEGHAASADEWGVMKTTAIQTGRFQPEASKMLPTSFSPRPWLGLRHNDILITRAGPRSRCGVVCRVVGDHPKLLLCDKAYRLAFAEEATSAQFIELLLCSPAASDAIENLKTGINDSGVNITQTSFLQLTVPIPPLPEQQEIVRLLDEQFTVIEQNEREIAAALKRSEALRQSILKKAFSGQLVPQNLTDEPAATLLERIRKARETAEKGLSPKKTATKISAEKPRL